MKKFFFGICAAVFLFGLSELGLRLSGFEFHPPFSLNPVFSQSDGLLETRPEYTAAIQQQRIRLADPAQDFRIGLVGGSSIHNLANADDLRVLLHAHSHRFLPLINMGGVSYGTVRERALWPELLALHPNVIFLYTGHNEFEEDYLHELNAATEPFHALDGWLGAHLRLYQGVSYSLHAAGGMLLRRNQLVPVVDAAHRMQWSNVPDREKVYALYRANLEAMAEMARAAKAPLILGTVAYNRLIPPFNKGESQAYRLGMEQFQQGNYLLAAPLLEQGLDEDLSPHRATNRSNQIVREVAEKFSLPLLDVDAEIKNIAPHRIPGPELFDDHCHLNQTRGNKILQRLLAGKILSAGFLPP